ncbi:hypothetical protein [Actinophytocola sp.]|uniref:hypothetical protein n=1 Tax=Actinophytocola sp. TaxID=1872138 RepID=UPI002ED1C31B
MQRTLSFRAADDSTVLLEEPTTVFRLTPACERGAGQLGIAAGRKARVELRNEGGHLLDYWIYQVN